MVTVSPEGADAVVVVVVVVVVVDDGSGVAAAVCALLSGTRVARVKLATRPIL
jgi:hexokinase